MIKAIHSTSLGAGDIDAGRYATSSRRVHGERKLDWWNGGQYSVLVNDEVQHYARSGVAEIILGTVDAPPQNQMHPGKIRAI
jgi:hypothetical protein